MVHLITMHPTRQPLFAKHKENIVPHRNQIHSTLSRFTLLLFLAASSLPVNATQPQGQTGPSMMAAQSKQESQLLEPGKPPIKREMSAAEPHRYHFAAKAGEYVRVIVEQRGIDVLVKLYGPDDRVIVEVDTTSRDGTQGPEDVRAIAEVSGTYRLEVLPLEPSAKPGHYDVRIEEQRAATQKDQDHLSAERAGKEAEAFRSKGDAQSLRNAIAKFEEAARFRHAAGEISMEGEMLFFVGNIYAALHNAQRALEYYEKARRILRSDEKNSFFAATLNELGAVYASLNYPQKALDRYREAQRLFQSLNLRAQVATTFHNMGQIYRSVNDKEEALRYYEVEALPIMRELKGHPDLPFTLSNLGELYYSMDKPGKALDLYNEALPLFRTIKEDQRLPPFYRNKYILGEARTLNNLAQLKGGQASTRGEAFENYEQALRIFQQFGDIPDEVATLGNMGTLYELSGRKEEALKSYLRAIDLLETLRASVTVGELRAGIADFLALVYKAGLLYMSMRQGAEAFKLTELARARTFLDQIGNVRPGLLQTTDEQLIKDRQKLESDINTLERMIEQGGAQPEVETDHTDYDAAQHLYEDLLIRYKLADPANASARSVQTLSLPEVQRQLDKETTLLSYFVGPDETLAFVITQGTFQAVKIPVKDKVLIEKIRWFRTFPKPENTSTAAPDPSGVPLKQLYDLLISPVRPYLKTQTIGVIPHRELHFLPFAALTDGRQYFGAKHSLFYLPSASALPFIMKSNPVGTRMLALAQSRAARVAPLHYADAEAETVARLYNTRALTTGTSSKSEFLKRAAEYNLIHIAAHARRDTVSPLFYGISLGADKENTEKLEIREIYHLNLSQTSLVVLSACHTNWGIPTQGDDIIALNRAFLHAGASTVIASLWLVDDKATGELMAAFYKYLKRGMSKAEALRAAQSDTRRNHPDPFYWASFVLTGNPGR